MTEADFVALSGFALTACTLIAAMAALWCYGNSRYWKGRAISLERELSRSDQLDYEVLFWRHHFDAEAAAWVAEQ